MEIGKNMSMAEFNVAYNAYRDSLMREGTIGTFLVSQHPYLYCHVVDDTNIS